MMLMFFFCTVFKQQYKMPAKSTAPSWMTPQVMVAMVAYALLLVLILLPLDLFIYKEDSSSYVKQQWSVGQRVVLLLLMLLPFGLSVFTVSCVSSGYTPACGAWGWIIAIITMLWAIVVAVTALSSGRVQLDALV